MQSNMYLMVEDKAAIIIDPQVSFEALAYIKAAHADKVVVFLTHEHFDHTSGVNFFRRNFSNITVIAAKKCADHICKPKNNRPLALLKMVNNDNRKAIMKAYDSYRVEEILVDVSIENSRQFSVGKRRVVCRLAPGHSPGSMLVIMDDKYVFSGDYLIPDTAVILRYPGGSHQEYQERTLPILQNISDDSIILPGHGESYRYADARYVLD